MLISLPDDVVRKIPLSSPETAVAEFAGLLAGIRPGAAADLEAMAHEAVDTALRHGAVLLAVAHPDGADPALLTGVAMAAPPTWDLDSAQSLRDAVEDVAGPDVRETLLVTTSLGPAVIAQRVPGPEQARDRRPLTLQLQAFIPEPNTRRMLLLTLASPSTTGWSTHQRLFAEIVVSANHDPADDFAPADLHPTTARPPTPADDDESFETHTFRVT
ncbi:hypothetical protein [Actinokineospora pegani]|uniref:hypothetical protein n=1 Tax=Actinokineospora pegani TaxID=2654637 RepID=UPI0012E9D042|nr:hypothetical protein [Actinokineospora pegani]